MAPLAKRRKADTFGVRLAYRCRQQSNRLPNRQGPNRASRRNGGGETPLVSIVDGVG
jgi:hypothetical protein